MTKLSKNAIGCISVLVLAAGSIAQRPPKLDETSLIRTDHPSIRYEGQNTQDRAAGLGRDLENGKVKLDRGGDFGYLPSLLKALGINADSQMLVFSKTSFQAAK